MKKPTKFIIAIGCAIAIHLPTEAYAQNPFDTKPASGNPFDQGTLTTGAKSPFTGIWKGDGVELELKAVTGSQLTGTLKRGGTEFPVEAKDSQGVLNGRFKAGASDYDFMIQEDASGSFVFTTGSFQVVMKPDVVGAKPFVINELGLELIPIPAGSATDQALYGNLVAKPFWLGSREITHAQWFMVMGTKPSHFKGTGDSAPVVNATPADALEFCMTLTRIEGDKGSLPAGHVFLPPTKPQWEYGCKNRHVPTAQGETPGFRVGLSPGSQDDLIKLAASEKAKAEAESRREAMAASEKAKAEAESRREAMAAVENQRATAAAAVKRKAADGAKRQAAMLEESLYAKLTTEQRETLAHAAGKFKRTSDTSVLLRFIEWTTPAMSNPLEHLMILKAEDRLKELGRVRKPSRQPITD